MPFPTCSERSYEFLNRLWAQKICQFFGRLDIKKAVRLIKVTLGFVNAVPNLLGKKLRVSRQVMGPKIGAKTQTLTHMEIRANG